MAKRFSGGHDPRAMQDRTQDEILDSRQNGFRELYRVDVEARLGQESRSFRLTIFGVLADSDGGGGGGGGGSSTRGSPPPHPRLNPDHHSGYPGAPHASPRASPSIQLPYSCLLFQLVDPVRPFLLYELELDPRRFGIIRQEQQLLVEFSEFPARVAELMELCRSDPRMVLTLHPFTCSPPPPPPPAAVAGDLRGGGSFRREPPNQSRDSVALHSGDPLSGNNPGKEGVLLEIVETNEFRRLQYLCLEFHMATDVAIKSHLARQVASLNQSRASLEQRLNEFQERLNSEREIRRRLNQEIEKLKLRQQREVEAWERQDVEQKDLERSLRRWQADSESLRSHIRRLESEVSTLKTQLERAATQAAAQQAESLQQLELMQLEIRKGNAIIQRQHMALKRARQQISDLRAPQSLDMAPFPLHPPVLMEQPPRPLQDPTTTFRQFLSPDFQSNHLGVPSPSLQRTQAPSQQPTAGSGHHHYPVPTQELQPHTSHQQYQRNPPALSSPSRSQQQNSHPNPPSDGDMQHQQQGDREDDADQLRKQLEAANARISDNLRVIEWLNREMNKAKQRIPPNPSSVPVSPADAQQHHGRSPEPGRADLEELQNISRIQPLNLQGRSTVQSRLLGSGHSLGEELFPPVNPNARGGGTRSPLPPSPEGFRKAKLQ